MTPPRAFAAPERPRAADRLPGRRLGRAFFDRDAQEIARGLLGKVLAHRVGGAWLLAQVIEAEAYYLEEKGSHASLGYTHKRRALFMAPGTLYLYYARGGDSINVSCRGAGNAVLIKAGHPYLDAPGAAAMVARMQALNPRPSGEPRPPERLCAGQTLLCRALGLKVPEWDARAPEPGRLEWRDVGLRPAQVIRTQRLGIPPGRDGHLPYRFVDAAYARWCTRNPLGRGAIAGRDYTLLTP